MNRIDLGNDNYEKDQSQVILKGPNLENAESGNRKHVKLHILKGINWKWQLWKRRTEKGTSEKDKSETWRLWKEKPANMERGSAATGKTKKGRKIQIAKGNGNT